MYTVYYNNNICNFKRYIDILLLILILLCMYGMYTSVAKNIPHATNEQMRERGTQRFRNDKVSNKSFSFSMETKQCVYAVLTMSVLIVAQPFLSFTMSRFGHKVFVLPKKTVIVYTMYVYSITHQKPKVHSICVLVLTSTLHIV